MNTQSTSCLLLLGLLAACSSTLPNVPPPLADFEEPLDLQREPDDEAARRALPAGAFSGLVVDDARDTLAAKLDEPGSLRIVAIVENSPADAAGLQVGDELLEATLPGQPPRALRAPSDWRQLELEAPTNAAVTLVVDRAGREAKTTLQLVPRARPAARTASERFREEARVGVVLRTATEVEARAAGLGPGAGAVIVGLSRQSPWRHAGLGFGDVLTHVDDRAIAHPQDVLAVLREPDRDQVRLTGRRGGTPFACDALLTTRAQDLRELSIPILFSYSSTRGRSDWSLLWGLLGHESTEAAWRMRVLWLITFGGGDADTLLERTP